MRLLGKHWAVADDTKHPPVLLYSMDGFDDGVLDFQVPAPHMAELLEALQGSGISFNRTIADRAADGEYEPTEERG